VKTGKCLSRLVPHESHQAKQRAARRASSRQRIDFKQHDK
jgi:hypothetical protein